MTDCHGAIHFWPDDAEPGDTCNCGNFYRWENRIEVADRFTLRPATEPLPPSFDAAAAFEELWAVYPNAKAKKVCREVWLRLKPVAAVFSDIMAALEWQCRDPNWLEENGRFVPRLDRYLRHERWKDRPRRGPSLNDRTTQTLAAGDSFVTRQLRKGTGAR